MWSLTNWKPRHILTGTELSVKQSGDHHLASIISNKITLLFSIHRSRLTLHRMLQEFISKELPNFQPNCHMILTILYERNQSGQCYISCFYSRQTQVGCISFSNYTEKSMTLYVASVSMKTTRSVMTLALSFQLKYGSFDKCTFLQLLVFYSTGITFYWLRKNLGQNFAFL